jgi:hypothetical protein
MRQPRYPLEPLAELRKRALDVATSRLSGAVKKRDAAARARQTAEDARHEHESAAARVRDAESGALERGELRAGDLSLVASWDHRIQSERARLRAGVERAKAAETEAMDLRCQAQARAEICRSQADVVEKDRARWDGARKKSAEAREEEAVSDGWRPKR